MKNNKLHEYLININEFFRNIIISKEIKVLKNYKFTIISSDCMGGIIYHDLHKQFTSPTINLFFDNNLDFLEYVKDLDYYNNTKLIFKYFDKYPIGYLVGDDTHKDVIIHFMHYKTWDDAYNKWIERSKRIQKDIFVILNQFEIENTYYDKLEEINSKYHLFVITSKLDTQSIKKEYIHKSNYLSKLDKNNGKLISFSSIFGKRNFDDLKINKYFIKQLKLPK